MTTPNEKLQRARLEKRWSVAAASRRAGVSVNTFNRWERGLQVPQLATLDQLLAAFEMSAEELGFGFVLSPPGKMVSTSTSSSVLEVRETLVETVSSESLTVECVSSTSLSYGQKSSRAAHLQPAASARVEAEAEQVSRRRVIAALIGTPAAIFCSRQGDNLSLLRAEEILTLCASHIPLCWQLYFEGGRAEVEKVLPDYIAQLATLARHPSLYQQRAAMLLSQAYQLASLLATQHQDYGAASTAAQEALTYGELAGDASLQVGALIRQALVSFFLKRSRPCLQAYQSALQLASQASPLLRGRVYVGLAEAYSQREQEDEARRCLELGLEIFPQKSEDDPGYSYTHFTHTSISTYEGLMYLNLHQHAECEQALARIDRMISTDAVPNRLELLVHQAMLAGSQGELEQTSALIKAALPMAQTLGSQLRSDQIYEVYESLLGKWGKEPVVKELRELFH
ncbi:MAG TPA: helix-turn-helix transcriptional regulator [Ktedonobacteraceae bacterium]